MRRRLSKKSSSFHDRRDGAEAEMLPPHVLLTRVQRVSTCRAAALLEVKLRRPHLTHSVCVLFLLFPKLPFSSPSTLKLKNTRFFPLSQESKELEWRKSTMRICLTRRCYREKINVNKLRAAAAESECVTDHELDLLHKKFEEKDRIEQMLRGELRVTFNEIDDLEGQQVSFEDQRQTIKKLEQDDLRAQMQLSMYASVTNIIPCLDDQSKISGHIVDKNKKMAEKFEFDRAKFTAFQTCGYLWRMTSL